MSRKQTIMLLLLVSSLYLVILLVNGLLFFDEGKIKIEAKPAEYSLIMTGRDDKDSVRLELIPGKTIDLNSADAQELELLPGIGEGLAESIVDYRRANGDFQSTEDIMEIDGIGKGKFAAIEDMITVGD